MAYLDFKDLQDNVIARGYGEVDRTRIKGFLNESAEDVNRRHRWSFNHTQWSLVTVAGTATISLSALNPSMQYFGSVIPNNATTGQLVYVEYDNPSVDSPWRDFPSTTLGMPFYVTLFNLYTLYLSPTPDAVYSYRMTGWKRHVQMTADADVPAMPQEHRMVLVAGALMKAAERDKDTNMMQYWNAQYESQYAAMLRADLAARQTQNGMVAALPSSYRGRFDT